MYRKIPVVLRDRCYVSRRLKKEVAKIKTLELEKQMYVRNSMFFPEDVIFLNDKKKENNLEPQTKPVTVPFKGKKNKQPHYKTK